MVHDYPEALIAAAEGGRGERGGGGEGGGWGRGEGRGGSMDEEK